MNWNAKLSPFATRVRFIRAWKWAAIGATCGAAVSVVLAALDWASVRLAEPWQLIVPIAVGLLAGAILGLFKRVNLGALADSLDRRADLGNRLSTALEEGHAQFSDAQRDDAVAHLGGLKPAKAYPVRLTAWHFGPIALALVAAILFTLGNTPLFLSESAKKDRDEVVQKGKDLEKVAKPTLEKPEKEVAPDARELARKIERLGKDLQKGRMSKEEAMSKQDELAKQARELETKGFQQAVEQAQQSMKSMEDIAKEQAAKELGIDPQKAAELMDDESLKNMSSEQLKEQSSSAQQKLSEIEKQLQDGKSSDGKPLSKEEIENLQKMQKELRDLLSKYQLSQKIKDFMDRIRNNPAFKDYMKALQELQKAQQQSQDQKLNPEMTKKELEELRKKLDEQFEKMKAELEKMADQMSDKDIEDMIRKMLEALKKGCGT